MRRITAFALAAVISSAAIAVAQDQQGQPPRPCSTVEYRQFDFWLGDWEVTNKGQVSGKNSIKVILNGCVLLEEWAGASGYTGKSYNRYDALTGKWEQYWVDSQGGVLRLEGGLVDGNMVLSGEAITNGETVVNRITWTPNDDGTVRQHWESSKDDGKTWATLFDGLYAPAKKG